MGNKNKERQWSTPRITILRKRKRLVQNRVDDEHAYAVPDSIFIFTMLGIRYWQLCVSHLCRLLLLQHSQDREPTFGTIFCWPRIVRHLRLLKIIVKPVVDAEQSESAINSAKLGSYYPENAAIENDEQMRYTQLQYLISQNSKMNMSLVQHTRASFISTSVLIAFASADSDSRSSLHCRSLFLFPC